MGVKGWWSAKNVIRKELVETGMRAGFGRGGTARRGPSKLRVKWWLRITDKITMKA
jgi:hypothetical protein